MSSTGFKIERIVNAPRQLVWKVYTQADHLIHWFGPKGMPMTECKMDFRVGGIFHYCLRMPDGTDMWGKWTFREIDAPNKLVTVTSFSDKDGGITRHPMAPGWPSETLGITTFEDAGEGKTRIRIDWAAINATPEEQALFDASHESMNQGWSGTFEQLVEYLAKL